jgi:hypothetical protein
MTGSIHPEHVRDHITLKTIGILRRLIEQSAPWSPGSLAVGGEHVFQPADTPPSVSNMFINIVYADVKFIEIMAL